MGNNEGISGYSRVTQSTAEASTEDAEISTHHELLMNYLWSIYEPSPCLCFNNNESIDASFVQVLPNPVGDELKVEYYFFDPSAEKTITIYNLGGQKIFSKCVDNLLGMENIDVSHLPAGNYVVSLGGKPDKMFSAQFTVVR